MSKDKHKMIDVKCKKCDEPRLRHASQEIDHRFTELAPLEYYSEKCECGSGARNHKFGGHKSCEYFEHHCDSCHLMHICTLKACNDDTTN